MQKFDGHSVSFKLIESGGQDRSCAIELKFFKKANHREPKNRYDVFKDVQRLAGSRSLADAGYMLVVTDHRHYVDHDVYSSDTTDFDFWHGRSYAAGTAMTYRGQYGDRSCYGTATGSSGPRPPALFSTFCSRCRSSIECWRPAPTRAVEPGKAFDCRYVFSTLLAALLVAKHLVDNALRSVLIDACRSYVESKVSNSSTKEPA